MGVPPQVNNDESVLPTLREREKAERDFSLRAAELAIAREELTIKKRELELKEEDHRYSRWLNPVFLGLVAATLTLLGNIYVTHQQSKTAAPQEETREGGRTAGLCPRVSFCRIAGSDFVRFVRAGRNR
jgi:hypothetical protein